MTNRARLAAAFAALAALFTGLTSEDALARRPHKKHANDEAAERLPPKHPKYGVPVFRGAREASEKTKRGLGLDAFEGYRIGVFFTSASAADVATFYIRALGRTVKKEKTEETLRYTLMIEPPSGENPLGEKVVVDESEGGVRDEDGTLFKTSITVYRKGS
jgi:hypothetical protein